MTSITNTVSSAVRTCIIALMLAGPIGAALGWTPPPQNPPQPPSPPVYEPPTAPAPVKKIGENLVQMGSILVDTQKKEVTVPGETLSDRTLEFVASAKGGPKNYESAIELDTDAISFNLALIMIGLEKSRGVAPRLHFDQSAAEGDPVEIWVEWGGGDSHRKLRVEEIIYDMANNRVPNIGSWVYTGSTVLPDGRYLSEIDGVLIGFVHDPASIIENAMGIGMGAYGSIRLNPDIKLAPGTRVKLTVKALPRSGQN
jgi:hypothetical protein